MSDADVLCEVKDDAGAVRVWAFWCPGCSSVHQVHKDAWTFNGSLERPTFSPSYLVHAEPAIKRPRCHSFIMDGKISFCPDSTHELAGQTVRLEPFGTMRDRLEQDFEFKTERRRSP